MFRSLELERLRHIRRRREDLRSNLDFSESFTQWAESCVPSYCHGNWAAALLSWERLFTAIDLAEENSRSDRPNVLDFGASVGELFHLLPPYVGSYAFVEQDAKAATFLQQRCPGARQTMLERDRQLYDWIFAIDSLEHNQNYDEILAALVAMLAPNGILVLSGPTENWLYRTGRRLAGFAGGYHTTSIYEIESSAEGFLARLDTVVLYPFSSLFRMSVWGRETGGR